MGPETLCFAPCVNGELVVGWARSLRGVGENVLTGVLLYFDEQIHQAHVWEVEVRPAAACLVLIDVRDEVTLVLVTESEQTDVRHDGPNHARFFGPFRGVNENETTRVSYLIEIITLKLVRLDR